MISIGRLLAIIAIVLGLASFQAGRASAASLCVALGGAGGCYATIAAAVTVAAAGDTVTVQAGTYPETITIDKALTLTGTGSPVIDATGLRDGITISKTSGVTIANLTIENAGAMAIDVESSSNVTISGNVLVHNDKNLTPSATCPGGPAADQDDCGGTIFLSGVTSSTISGNTIVKNADGIVLTDEAGPSSGNTISGNFVDYNGPECGIVLASHKGAAPNGVFNNVIENNDSSYNGASGIGIFAPSPGTAAHDNQVIGNTLNYNGHAGVTLHTHAPNTNDNNNQVLNNSFAGDNTLGDDSAGVSTTAGIIIAAAVNPVTGTVITGNTINLVSIGVFLGNASGTTLSGNQILARTPIMTVGAEALPNPERTTITGVSAAPYAWPYSPGVATSFVVSFVSPAGAQGEVLFGTSCNGLIMTGSQDAFAGTTQHWIQVTGDDLSPTGIGLTPGTTYYYEVVAVTGSGTITDDNGGKCYSVTIPSTPNATAADAAPTERLTRTRRKLYLAILPTKGWSASGTPPLRRCTARLLHDISPGGETRRPETSGLIFPGIRALLDSVICSAERCVECRTAMRIHRQGNRAGSPRREG
jgi:parallel beta-helix repeat protein